MQLTSIAYRNFRCFGDRGFQIDPAPGLNALVGENNVGKSAVFHAMRALLAGGGIDLNEAPWWSPGALPSLRIEFELAESEFTTLMEQWWRSAVDSQAGRGGAAIDAVAGLFDRTGAVEFPSVILQERRTAWSLGPFALRRGSAIAGPTAGKKELSWGAFLHNFANDPARVEYRLFGDKIPLEIPAPAEDSLQGLVGERIAAFSDVRSRPMGRGGGEGASVRTSLDGSSTADLLMNLKIGTASERAQFRQIQADFSSFFPHLRVEVRGSQGSPPEVVFSPADYEIDVPQLLVGTGVLEILTLLANLVARKGQVIVVEEPELHLHPLGQRALKRRIESSARDNQIFLITHSPEFVDLARPEGVFRIWSGTEGARCSPCPVGFTKQSQAALVEALREYSKREMLFARAVLLVEGETERAFVGAIAPRVNRDLDASGVAVVAVDGKWFQPYIDIVDALELPFKCLRDGNKGGSQFRFSDRFVYLKKPSIEEYWESAGLGDLVKEARSKVGTEKENKPRIGRYIGVHMPSDAVPKLFLDLLDDMIRLTSAAG